MNILFGKNCAKTKQFYFTFGSSLYLDKIAMQCPKSCVLNPLFLFDQMMNELIG